MKIKKSNVKSLNSKLVAYSATAGAALALAPAADATIQNITTFSINGGSFSATAPDLAGTGSLLFETNIHQDSFKLNIYHLSSSYALARMAGNIAGSGSSGYRAFKLGIGDAIAGKSFRTGSHLLALSVSGQFLPTGANAATTGYIGFKDVVGGSQTYYGWLRVQVTNDGNGYPFEVSLVSKDGNPGIFGAIDNKNDITSDSFAAGAIAVPEPSVAAIGGLGLLALGAVGIREMRRRKKTQEKI